MAAPFEEVGLERLAEVETALAELERDGQVKTLRDPTGQMIFVIALADQWDAALAKFEYWTMTNFGQTAAQYVADMKRWQ